MIDYILFTLANSRMFSGVVMILMNLGGRYIAMEVPSSADRVLGHPLMRKFYVFCIAFMATRDIKVAVLITLLFFVIFKFLFNENSKSCILPKKQEEVKKEKELTYEEVQKAKEILKRYNEQLENQKVKVA